MMMRSHDIPERICRLGRHVSTDGGPPLLASAPSWGWPPARRQRPRVPTPLTCVRRSPPIRFRLAPTTNAAVAVSIRAVDAHAVAAEALEWLRAQPAWLAAGTIGVIAGLEYVAPPVPGDTVAIAGGVLVAQGILGAPLVITVVTLCSVLGALGAYGMGRLAASRPGVRRLLFRFVAEESFEDIAAKYRRWGRLIILANRFFPGVRTSFLMAAGFFRVPVGDVVVFGALSAFVWNSLLIGAGFALGANIDAVINLVEEYSTFAWVALVLILGVVVTRIAMKGLARRRGPS